MVTMVEIPVDHPRYESLLQRKKVEDALDEGILAKAGLLAHGRGEAFDYLIGEKTTESALISIRAACRRLLHARHPVISVNGNVAALVPQEIVTLSKMIPAFLEINLFYKSENRVKAICRKLCSIDSTIKILGVDPEYRELIPGLSSKRGEVDKRGIYKGDVVLVALEDGDRTEALKNMGKVVIAIDLNPLSRTAQYADVTIVDNVVRAVPVMISVIEEMNQSLNSSPCNEFDNQTNLRSSIHEMITNLSTYFKEVIP
jgi:4-phosphopantoate--beta-alanine ligase